MSDYKKSDAQIDMAVHTAEVPKFEDENMEPIGAPDEAD